MAKQRPRMTIASVTVQVPERFDQLLEALARCDGVVMSIDLEASECRDILISAGFAVENRNGWLYGTDRLRKELNVLLAQYLKENGPQPGATAYH